MHSYTNRSSSSRELLPSLQTLPSTLSISRPSSSTTLRIASSHVWSLGRAADANEVAMWRACARTGRRRRVRPDRPCSARLVNAVQRK